MPSRGPVATAVPGHALVEHLPGGEAAAAGGAVGDAVPAGAVHVPRGSACERLVADVAVLGLQPAEHRATGPASPCHVWSSVSTF